MLVSGGTFTINEHKGQHALSCLQMIQALKERKKEDIKDNISRKGLAILLHVTFLLTEIVQVERRASDLVSSFRTGGEESNCLGKVPDKESVGNGLDAWVLFARRQAGEVC